MSHDGLTYDGRVTPGGPWAVRELPEATIYKLAVSEMSNNVYLIEDRVSHDAILIDAADDWPAIAAMIENSAARVRTILTTHRHWDHVRALQEAAEATGAQTAAGVADVDAIPVRTDIPLAHGDRLTVGSLTLDVIALRGHTPGSVAVALTSADGVQLFTGDSLFPGGVGATNHYDYQSFPSLIADVSDRIFDVYDDAWVYPGHGDDTTLGAERANV